MSKNIRDLVLANFNQIFDLATGFCTIEYWNNLIQKHCFDFIEHIHNKTYLDERFFDCSFDFEQNYFKLLKYFRHFSLFLIYLHFLRCIRSCDKESNCCRLVQGFYQINFMSVMLFHVCFLERQILT